ncbi:MAG: HAMP domain-containing histidine kinase [Clostridia bacterium]|nr:HAMP domain-containing histidine kinase [Clostridia bacterium]MBR2885601.1 HAMP domain-containing histidine kinase [Clostridia bacterium]
MKKRDISKYTNKIIPQFLILLVAAVIVVASGYFFMTWLVSDVLDVEGTYISASFEVVGTIVLLMLILIPMIIIFYRSRKKEIKILSEGIAHLAEGDFNYKIPLKKKDSLARVYANFNKMCEELKSVQILRNDFINSYSHEFKTPIASINGFASLLLEKNLTPQEREQYLTIIIEETDRLSRLATNTILLSKLSSQQIVTDVEPYDLSEQIRQCSIILSKKWMEKKIDFDCELEEVTFAGNRELMQHLWLNIISNAIEHTNKGGRITVSLCQDKEKVCVSVSDNGEGMDEQTLRHLFDPYFQGDASHSSQGLGLGLSIAKRIVELCRGEILVESRLREGSRFTVNLPVV